MYKKVKEDFTLRSSRDGHSSSSNISSTPSPAGPPGCCLLHFLHLFCLSFIIGMPNRSCILKLRRNQCFVCNFLYALDFSHVGRFTHVVCLHYLLPYVGNIDTNIDIGTIGKTLNGICLPIVPFLPLVRTRNACIDMGYVRGSPNGNICKSTNGTVGTICTNGNQKTLNAFCCQWYHWYQRYHW